MDGKVLVAEAIAMRNHPEIKSNPRKPLKWGFFIPKFDLSESCQKKTRFLEFFYFGETHKTLVIIGGRGGIRTHGSLATTSDFESDAFNHSATLPKMAEQTTLTTLQEQGQARHIAALIFSSAAACAAFNTSGCVGTISSRA